MQDTTFSFQMPPQLCKHPQYCDLAHTHKLGNLMGLTKLIKGCFVYTAERLVKAEICTIFECVQDRTLIWLIDPGPLICILTVDDTTMTRHHHECCKSGLKLNSEPCQVFRCLHDSPCLLPSILHSTAAWSIIRLLLQVLDH